MKKVWFLVATVALGSVALAGAEEGHKADRPEVKLKLAQVPAAVQATLQREAQGAPIQTVDREGEGSATVYETDVLINGQNWEIRVAPDGKLLTKKLDSEDEEAEEEEEEDEVRLPLAQVPPAVQMTLRREAQGASIDTVDREGEGATVVYEADAVIDGKNWEIRVAPDGKLLGKKLDPEDEPGEAPHK